MNKTIPVYSHQEFCRLMDENVPKTVAVEFVSINTKINFSSLKEAKLLVEDYFQVIRSPKAQVVVTF